MNTIEKESESTGRVLEDLLSKVYGGILPRTLRILVLLAEDLGNSGAAPCEAMSLEFPVAARAETAEDAVQEVLIDLVNYLEGCVNSRSFAFCWADKVYDAAFAFGDDMPRKSEAQVRLSKPLAKYLGLTTKDNLESRLQIRDVRHLQSKAGNESLENIFCLVA